MEVDKHLVTDKMEISWNKSGRFPSTSLKWTDSKTETSVSKIHVQELHKFAQIDVRRPQLVQGTKP